MLCILFQPFTGWAPPPVWWFDSHLVVLCLNGIAILPTKWDSFFVYFGLFFSKKVCCVYHQCKYSDMLNLLHNKTFVLNIICVEFSARVFKRRSKWNATQKSCINNVFLSSKRSILSTINICLTENVLEFTSCH